MENFVETLLMIEEMDLVVETCKEFVEKLDKHNISLPMKQSAWCLLCDMLFEENAVEIAKDCAEHIKEVNENLGTL